MHTLYAQQKPRKEVLSQNPLFVFLIGPTPWYFHKNLQDVKPGWRQSVIKYLSSSELLKEGKRPFVLVIPEPESLKWSDLDLDPKESLDSKIERQVLWENKYLKKSEILGISCGISFVKKKESEEHCPLCQSFANCGTTTRFEVGQYIHAKDKTKVFYLPDWSEGTGWVKVHLGPLSKDKNKEKEKEKEEVKEKDKDKDKENKNYHRDFSSFLGDLEKKIQVSIKKPYEERRTATLEKLCQTIADKLRPETSKDEALQMLDKLEKEIQIQKAKLLLK